MKLCQTKGSARWYRGLFLTTNDRSFLSSFATNYIPKVATPRAQNAVPNP